MATNIYKLTTSTVYQDLCALCNCFHTKFSCFYLGSSTNQHKLNSELKIQSVNRQHFMNIYGADDG